MATTVAHGSTHGWTITLTIPRPSRIRWRWLTVAALIAGAVFVAALTVAGARQTYAPAQPGPVGPMPCDVVAVGGEELLPHAAADPMPACPTQP